MTKATVVAKGMEMIVSGFVSKVDNNLVDFGWNKIKNVNNERNSHEQNIETRIYQATVDAINAFTFNEYKNQDILFYVAENILRGFISKKENIEAVKTGLKMLESQITDDRCEDFLGTLCDEICKDENDILYREIVLMQNNQLNEGVHEGFKRSEQNQEYIREVIHKGFERSEQNHQETQRKLDYLVEKIDSKESNFYCKPVENRADEYAEKWEKNVFLNDFNKRDKNAGVNVKLKDIYLEEQLPHYTWKRDSEPLSDLKELLKEYTVDNEGKNMLLILGQPGIGKSTLITWIMANFEKKKDDFLVYQFASDLKNINWQGDNAFCEILKTIHLKKDDLKDKVLILDGFDEINTNSDRERILNELNHEMAGIRYFINFSLVITCRENYVHELEKIECDFITLQVWEDNQIRCFCEAYSKESGSDIATSKMDKILEKKEVFGIPLILYMVLALGIAIEKSESLVDVYDQIFSIDRSSIYERCIKNLRYDGEHRISKDEIKRAIHQISQKIAFWIFENKSEKAFVPQKEYEDICNTVIKEISNGNENIKRDFLIGNYFKITKHCEGIGTEELQFVHRSIYEYFVVVYFFESLQNQTTKEEVAGKLGELLKKGELSLQILEFIKYKFHKINKNNLSNITRQIFQLMLQDGMTYHSERKYKNVIVREMNIFANMLEVVHLWNSELGKLDNIVCYLQYNRRKYLNLQNIDLSRTDLSGVDLSEADLNEADLSGTDLSGTNLSEADLSEADLSEADLSKANLSRANLSETNLSKADLSETNLSEANLSGANLSGTDLSEADLSRANLSRTNLREANLNGANLIGKDLISVNISGANLIRANLRGANLSEANLSEADLNEANLIGVDLIGTDLRGANLIRANLRGANLRGANLSEADLSETIFDEDLFDMLYEKYDLSESNIFVFNISDVVSYNDYVLENNSKNK